MSSFHEHFLVPSSFLIILIVRIRMSEEAGDKVVIGDMQLPFDPCCNSLKDQNGLAKQVIIFIHEFLRYGA